MLLESREKPLVSVMMITYNQEQFIAQAIEGVVMQKASFKFELVIGEDFSVDSTRLICEQYAAKYPDTVKLLPSERNLGILINGLRTLDQCSGTYIAMCEGDDYWTDMEKLQKQVDYLNNDTDIGLVHTAGDIINLSTGETKKNVYQPNKQSHVSQFVDIITWNYRILTCSILFRRDIFDKYVDFSSYPPFQMGDTPIFLEFAYNSKIGFINESMVVRRQLMESASKSQNKHRKSGFRLSNNEMRVYFIKKYYCPKPIKDEILLDYYKSLLYHDYLEMRHSENCKFAIRFVFRTEKSFVLKFKYLAMYLAAGKSSWF